MPFVVLAIALAVVGTWTTKASGRVSVNTKDRVMTDWTKRFSKVPVRVRESTFGGEPSSSVVQVRGIEKLNKSDLAALAETANVLGMHVDWLAAVISFETAGTFSPSILNAAGSGAFGLIQFMPKTAVAIFKMADTPENRIKASKRGRAMSFSQQLREMVIPYFKGGKYNSLNDVYLKVFYPVAMGKPDNYVVGEAPSKVYEQNKGFDKDKDGDIERNEITSSINAVLRNGLTLPRVEITKQQVQWASVIIGLGMVAAGAYYVSVNTNLLPIGPNARKPLGV